VPVGALAVALVGFATACCWINAFANELLGLLQFFGVLWGISDMVRCTARLTRRPWGH
jgi:ABC-type xylose transport system permease subunit